MIRAQQLSRLLTAARERLAPAGDQALIEYALIQEQMDVRPPQRWMEQLVGKEK